MNPVKFTSTNNPCKWTNKSKPNNIKLPLLGFSSLCPNALLPFLWTKWLFNFCTAPQKKVREFPVPSRDVTTKLSLGENNDVITELFLPRGNLVSDIPAGDGKLVNLFFTVYMQFKIPSVRGQNLGVTLLQPARRAAVLGQPSSLRPSLSLVVRVKTSNQHYLPLREEQLKDARRWKLLSGSATVYVWQRS